MRKIKAFLFLNLESKLLMIEALLYLGWARILKQKPFSKVAPSLGQYMEETAQVLADSESKKDLARVSQAIHMMSKYTFWESKCLVKAIAAMKMLERRRIGSTMYLGTAKDEKGDLIAHAWLRSGPYFICGSEGMEKFTVVSMFANKKSRKPIQGENYG
ncbi:lasso peptide biosynthesis B2 protein [Salipaludibacillus sp. CUR1]|uniref:lasso peptide biosynthesis B2 protein n=1 Tax=Salipaludibacillus sp. CUR1 TaxID=2820003 RepID=UPI001E448966|nr:lasso peptide biosynthesis B2 protein [Salipaludibacillus sp. CUR1]MCE7792757.1 lasso peptide biosynthesis B2 protein [Salipaludibacillus sp. CUR1]